MKQLDNQPNQAPPQNKDEDIGIIIYGNLKIKDLDTGKILVNQRA